MGFQRENFVGNPHKQEHVDEDEELEFLSGDEFDFNPFGLPPGDPDLMLDDNYDIITDDDDYDPEDDYEDYLSDSEYDYDEAEGSHESGPEQVNFSESDPEEAAATADTNQESNNKTNGDNKSVENKINVEVTPSGTDEVASTESHTNT